MKVRFILFIAVASSLAATAFGQADDPTTPTNRPSPEQLRSRAKRLTPQEREAAVRDLRGRLGPGSTNRSELERRREEWRSLPPAEREARIREFRERHLGPGQPRHSLSPAEREAKRAEIKERVQSQIRELEARQAVSDLSPVEQRRLERFRQMSRRLEQGTALGLPGRSVETEREGKDLPAPVPVPGSAPSTNRPGGDL